MAILFFGAYLLTRDAHYSPPGALLITWCISQKMEPNQMSKLTSAQEIFSQTSDMFRQERLSSVSRSKKSGSNANFLSSRCSFHSYCPFKTWIGLVYIWITLLTRWSINHPAIMEKLPDNGFMHSSTGHLEWRSLSKSKSSETYRADLGTLA